MNIQSLFILEIIPLVGVKSEICVDKTNQRLSITLHEKQEKTIDLIMFIYFNRMQIVE